MFPFKKKIVKNKLIQENKNTKEKNKVELNWNSIGKVLDLMHDYKLDNRCFCDKNGKLIAHKTASIEKIYHTYKYKEEIVVDENIKIIVEAIDWYRDTIERQFVKMLRATIYVKTIKIETFILYFDKHKQNWELHLENINYELNDDVKNFVNSWASINIRKIEHERELKIKEVTEKATREYQHNLDILAEIWDQYKGKDAENVVKKVS